MNNKGKTGPKPQYDFTQPEIIVGATKLSSFKTLVSRFNKDKADSDKLYFDFESSPNSSKVKAIRKQSA